MKNLTLVLLLLGLTITTDGQTFYRGLEPMCWTNNKGRTECYGAPKKWYHLNSVLIEKDSIFIYKVPVRIEKKDTIYSASDGAFYYYYGIISHSDSLNTVFLTRYNCDYCGSLTYIDTITGYHYPVPIFDTLTLTFGNGKLKLGNVTYNKFEADTLDPFPAKSYFYLDSNSILRIDPKEQYSLISQGIKNFIQTGELKCDSDTLRVCLDRFSGYEEIQLIETLNPERIKIDTTKIVFKFYTSEQLAWLTKHSDKPIRVIKINEIVEYWSMARISLTYKILLPKSVHNFSEKELHNLFEYNKIGTGYLLPGDLPKNSWVLVEQK